MPEIQKRYRTTGETAIVGESLAGLFVVETLPQMAEVASRLGKVLDTSAPSAIEWTHESMPIRRATDR